MIIFSSLSVRLSPSSLIVRSTRFSLASMKFSLLVALILLVIEEYMPSISANPAAAASLMFPWNRLLSSSREKIPAKPAPPLSSQVMLPPTAATTILSSQSLSSHGASKGKHDDSKLQKEPKGEIKADKEQEKAKKKKEEKISSCGDDNVYISRSILQWTNPNFPSGEQERVSCVLRIKRDPKCWQEIVQIKVIIADLHLAQPDDGACKKDNITIHGSQLQGQEVGQSLQLCGEEPDDYLWTSGKKYPQHKHCQCLTLLFSNDCSTI